MRRGSSHTFRRAARKLAAAHGPLALEVCEHERDLPRFFAVARDLYARSKAGRFVSGQFLTETGRRFYDEVAARLLAAGCLDFSVLRAGDRAVAFAFCSESNTALGVTFAVPRSPKTSGER